MELVLDDGDGSVSDVVVARGFCKLHPRWQGSTSVILVWIENNLELGRHPMALRCSFYASAVACLT